MAEEDYSYRDRRTLDRLQRELDEARDNAKEAEKNMIAELSKVSRNDVAKTLYNIYTAERRGERPPSFLANLGQNRIGVDNGIYLEDDEF